MDQAGLHEDQFATLTVFSPSGQFLAVVLSFFFFSFSYLRKLQALTILLPPSCSKAGMGGQLWIWETRQAVEAGLTGSPWTTEVLPLRITCLAFDPREERLAVVTWNGSLFIFQRVRSLFQFLLNERKSLGWDEGLKINS